MSPLKNLILGIFLLIAAILLALYIFVPQLMPGPGEIIRNTIIVIFLLWAFGTTMYVWIKQEIRGEIDSIESQILAKIYECTEIKKSPIWKEKLVECLKEKFSEKVISQEVERLVDLELIIISSERTKGFIEFYIIGDKEFYLARMIYDRINLVHKKAIEKIKELYYPLRSGQKVMDKDKEDQFLKIAGLYKEDLSHVPSSDLSKIRTLLEKFQKVTFFYDYTKRKIEKVVENIEKEEEIRQILSQYRG
ncbi:MAG: hypothetical protein NTU58_04345 [Candidatus Nealsonbacteria bacterium]|nr:hypothetical protein [Candidatus Nealsonbacteria bacterium]